MRTLPSGYGRIAIGALVGAASAALFFEGLAGGASDGLPPVDGAAVQADPASVPEPITPLQGTTQPGTTTVTSSSTTTSSTTTTTTVSTTTTTASAPPTTTTTTTTTEKPTTTTTTTTRCPLIIC